MLNYQEITSAVQQANLNLNEYIVHTGDGITILNIGKLDDDLEKEGVFDHGFWGRCIAANHSCPAQECSSWWHCSINDCQCWGPIPQQGISS